MFASILTLTLTTTAYADSPTWSQVIETGWTEVTTRTHEVAGEVKVLKRDINGLTCYKGEALSSLTPEQLVVVAKDIEGTMKWASAGVAEAEVLKPGENPEYYQYLDVPGWTMAADRFWFLKGQTIRKNGAITFNWDRLEQGGAHNARWQEVITAHPDAVEPPINIGGWVFTPSSDGTKIDYYICSDTGGSIPKSIQSAATQKTLPDTVGDLVREATRRVK